MCSNEAIWELCIGQQAVRIRVTPLHAAGGLSIEDALVLYVFDEKGAGYIVNDQMAAAAGLSGMLLRRLLTQIEDSQPIEELARLMQRNQLSDVEQQVYRGVLSLHVAPQGSSDPLLTSCFVHAAAQAILLHHRLAQELPIVG